MPPTLPIVILPLTGTAPQRLTKFPARALPGTAATLRQQLRAVAQKQPVPTVPKQTFKLAAQLLSDRSLSAIENVAKSLSPAEHLIKKERMSPELLIGSIYTALVVEQYKETKTQYEQALRQAGRLALGLREKAVAAVEAGFKTATAEHIAALKLGGLKVDEKGLERQATILGANRAAYQSILDMRAGATGAATIAAPPTTLVAEIVPVTVSDILHLNPFRDLHVPSNWCGFDPIEGSESKVFGDGFALKSTLSYPCGAKWCTKWGVPYPCGVKWCSKTITWASGSVALSLTVGYKISCCGGTAWGSGEVKACGTVLNQTLCASCEAHVGGAIGAGQVTGSGGQCAYGLGLTAGVSCKLGGYTVYSANFSFGWVIDAPCPPLNLCA